MNYIKSLDSLRAIAVFIVVFHHLPITDQLPVISTVFHGVTGVDVFFVLSGFLITSILFFEKQKNLSKKEILLSFYWRRFLRIFPIYYLTILLLFLLDIRDYRSCALYDILYVSNFNMGFRGEFTSINPHFWSLSVEEQFYLIWPFLLLFIPIKRSPFLIAVFLVIGIFSFSITYNTNWAFFGARTFNNWIYLSLGGLLAFIRLYKLEFFMLLRKWSSYFIAFYLTYKFILFYYELYLNDFVSIILNILFASFLVIWFSISSSRKWVQTIIENRFFVYLGKISYGIYLYHFLMIIPLSLFLKYCLSDMNFSLFQMNLFKILLCILVSSFSWYLIEKPLLKYKRS